MISTLWTIVFNEILAVKVEKRYGKNEVLKTLCSEKWASKKMQQLDQLRSMFKGTLNKLQYGHYSS